MPVARSKADINVPLGLHAGRRKDPARTCCRPWSTGSPSRSSKAEAMAIAAAVKLGRALVVAQFEKSSPTIIPTRAPQR